jgi:hypothetical protein
MANDVNFGTQQYFNFDPRAIPGCVLWLDALDSNTLYSDTAGTTLATAGGTVARWNDKSVSSNYVFQSTAGDRPTLSNIPSSNTYPAVYFSTQTVNLTSVANTPQTGNLSRTMFAIQHVTSGGIGRWAATGTHGGNTPPSAFGFDNNVSVTVLWAPYVYTGADNTFSVQVTGTRYIYAYYDSAVSQIGGGYDFSISNTKSTTLNTTATPLYFGRRPDGGGSVTSYLSEVLLYNSALTTAQRQQVEGYLAWKWNIRSTLPTSHPFKSNPPAMRLFEPIDVLNCAVWVDPADRSSILALSGNQPTSIRSKGHQLITLDNAQPVNNLGPGAPWTAWPPPAVTNYGTVFMTNTSSNLNTFQFTRTIGSGGVYGNGYNGSYLRIPSVAFTSQQRTMFFIVSPQSTGLDNYAHIFAPTIYQGSPNLRQRGFLDSGSIGYVMFPVTDPSTQVLVCGNSTPYTGAMLTNGTPYLFGMRHTTSTSSNYTSINGTQLTPPTNQALSSGYRTGTDECVIGIFTYARQILMGDFLLYDGAIQTSEIQQIEGYLAWKWGLRTSLPTTHPFRNFPPATALFVPPLLSNTLAVWFDAADLSSIITASLAISFNIFVTTSAQPVSYSGTLSSVSNFTGGTVVMNGAQIGAPSGSSARSGVWAPSATSGRWYAFIIDGGYCKTVLCEFVLTGSTLTVRGISTGFTSTVGNYLSASNSGATNDSYYATYDTANPIATTAFTPGYGVQSFVMNATNPSGGTVTTWQNKGTLGGTATSTTGTSTIGNTFNGLNYVNIPVGSEMRFTAAINTQARSWFFVARCTTAFTSNPQFWGPVNATANGRDGLVVYSDTSIFLLYNGPNGIDVNVSGYIANPFNRVGLYALVNSATAALNVVTDNGTSVALAASVAAGNFNTGSAQVIIGTAGYSKGNDIMEIILYYGDVTQSQRQRVEGYLAWKWGLRDKLPDTHPYYKFRP